MLQPFSESRVNWTVVRFLGHEQGSNTLARGLAQLDAAGGVGSGRGSGDRAAMEAAERAAERAVGERARRADPEIDPPPLKDGVPGAPAVEVS